MESSPPRVSREKILIVDDAAANLTLLATVLEPEGYEVLAASDGATAVRLAAKAQPDLVLLDILMPGMDGLEVCRLLKAEARTREIPVVFITARTEAGSMVAGFRAGGVDYVVKPFQAEEVTSRVAHHLHMRRLTRELLEKNRALEARTAELLAEAERRRTAETALRDADERLTALADLEAQRWSASGLLGASPAMRRVQDAVRRLGAFGHTTVLVTGESGTGKELVARAIHFGSARARAAFVPVNCVAVPAELAESLFFGHVKGAFTGATTDRKGYFELAHGGTLFLDEIGDMPPGLQVKLLRVLEDGWVTPVGGVQPRRVDVRIIAATNADLDARLESGAFRRDLYFRLARFQLSTPPLRDRLEDVPELAAHFLERFAAEMGLRSASLSDAALDVLRAYSFPGNVRELRNVLERALIESGGALLLPEHLHLPRRGMSGAPAVAQRGRLNTAPPDVPLNLAEAEEVLIQRALQEADGNIAEAARRLGVHRSRIYRALAKESPGTP